MPCFVYNQSIENHSFTMLLIGYLKAENDEFIDGYDIALGGVEIEYYTPMPSANKALITRAYNGQMAIHLAPIL